MNASDLLSCIKNDEQRLKDLEAEINSVSADLLPAHSYSVDRVQNNQINSRVEQLAIKRMDLQAEYAAALSNWAQNVAVLNSVLDQLSSLRQAEIIYMVYCLGYSPRSAAAEIGCTVECIYTHVNKAKKALNKLLIKQAAAKRS